MKKIAMIGAAALALGWSTAHAETASDTDDAGGAGTAGVGVGVGVTAPPPAANGDVGVNPVASPSEPGAAPSDAPAAAVNGAAVEPAPAPPIQPVAVPVNGRDTDTTYVENETWMHKVGAAILIGGGFERFTDGTLRAMTGDGGSWTARLVGGTRQFVGVEAAYVGSARSISALGVNAGNLVSNGVEGTLRLNIPLVRGATLLEPFGFVGIGWQHFNVTNNTVTSDVVGSDDVMTVPYGGGLELAYKSFIADARFTYRQTYYNDLLRVTGGNLNNWGVGGQIGVEF